MVAKIGQKCYHCYLKVKSAVEVVLPVKQGLKPSGSLPVLFPVSVEVVLPVKQGLKLTRVYVFFILSYS
jgi:phage tail protein X